MSNIITAPSSACNDVLQQFYADVLPRHGCYCLLLLPERRHVWASDVDELARLTAASRGRQGVYFATASFKDDPVRTQSNVLALRALRLDIDAGPDKLAKHGGDAVYASQKDAIADAVRVFGELRLRPTYFVSSGAGLHIYFCLSEDVAPTRWKPLAAALGAVCRAHGLKVDSSVTEDTARVLRPVGALHPNGQRVYVIKRYEQTHSVAELLEKFGVPADEPERHWDASVNAEVLSGGPARLADLNTILAGCQAMRDATATGGGPEPLWRAMLGVVKHCENGEELAHEVSRRDERYDPSETQRKFDGWSAGPATCDEFEKHSPSACGACPHRGKIKTPWSIGLASATPPVGAENNAQAATLPAWLAEMNERYSVVRVGSSAVVVDFRSPMVAMDGVRESLGFLDVSAFRTLQRGRLAPPEKPGDKSRPLADAWLSSPARRQFEGLMFSPGMTLPPTVLNLWQGFEVEPRDGDVSLWLTVLAALVPNESERSYVLKWLAWKVQHPGGVPDTLLILIGAKGTDKNSLFDPVLTMFGRHGLLVDNPELIAGRFTGHLMTAALAVLDEAVFTGDPRQADAIKARVTAKSMTYEQKGLDPVRGVNRCAYVMLTNHAHAWQATTDERRAVVLEISDSLRGDFAFWTRYHAWAEGFGPSALLHYLAALDVSDFNPRAIPKGEALRRQVEMTALRDPAAAWWFRCLSEGEVRYAGGRVQLKDNEPTQIDRAVLRESFEQSAAARGRSACWAATARKVVSWVGTGGVRKTRVREGGARAWHDVLPPLPQLRHAFTQATQIAFDE